MKFFTIYKIQTGEIVGSGNVPDISIQVVPDGCAIIEKFSNPSSEYVDGDQIVKMPLKPGNNYKFDFHLKSWEKDITSTIEGILSTRQSLLFSSDWTQLPDVPLETKQAWATYRQALRDITTQEGYPFNVIWPTKPE